MPVLSQTELEHTLNEIVTRLRAALSPVAIYLFGSYAYGTPHVARARRPGLSARVGRHLHRRRTGILGTRGALARLAARAGNRFAHLGAFATAA